MLMQDTGGTGQGLSDAAARGNLAAQGEITTNWWSGDRSKVTEPRPLRHVSGKAVAPESGESNPQLPPEAVGNLVGFIGLLREWYKQREERA